MRLKLNHYKITKLKTYLKTQKFFFVFHHVNSTKNLVKFEQTLKKLSLSYHNTTNNLIRTVLTQSIYNNLNLIVKGPCLLIKLFSIQNKTSLLLQDFIISKKLLTFFCLKINNKVYVFEQLKEIKELHYIKCFKNLKCFLQQYVFSILKSLKIDVKKG